MVSKRISKRCLFRACSKPRILAGLVIGFLLISLPVAAIGQSDTKMDQNSSGTKPADGSSSKNMGGQAMNDSGSGTRNDPGSGNVDAGSISKYRPAKPIQLDPDLLGAALESASKIDAMIDKGLKKNRVRPEKMTDDYEFVRRAYLDMAGTIPTGRQTVAFARSRIDRSEKRTMLIDRLLNSPGYVSHSFNYWAEILRLVDGIRGGLNLRPYNDWVKDSIASDMPYDQFVSKMLSAEGRVWENPPVGYTLRDRDMTKANLDNTMRIFLGTRIGCAQCHDHPFDSWTQKQFYELAAFVDGTSTRHNRSVISKATATAREEMASLPKSVDNANRSSRLRRFIGQSEIWVGEKRSKKLKLPDDYQYDNGKPGEVIKPKVAFGQPPKIKRDVPLRTTFSDWVTSPDNPRFTVTIVNRLWKRAFGAGLIEPVDNLTDTTDVSNEELLDFLVYEMKRVGYRQREFLRILYNTKAYQRKAFLKDWDPNKPYYFPGPVLRRMTAQQLWDSMLTLTMAEPDAYQRPRGDIYSKLASIEPGKSYSLSDVQQKYDAVRRAEGRDGKEAKMNKVFSHEGYLLVRASEMRQPQRPDHFLRQFGQSDRTLISGNSLDGHVPQILTMFNGPISHKLLYEGTVIYDEIAAASTMKDKVDVIFLSILTRHPTRLDERLALSEMEREGAAGVGNLIWSLLNTREFMFIQ